MIPADEASAALDPVLQDIAGARNYNDWLFDRARPHLGHRVLDAGAGIGTFADRVAAAGAEVVALESDPAFVDQLQARFAAAGQVTVVNGTIESLPAGLAGFDSILCLNVLEHVREDQSGVNAFRERLKPGGRLLLLVPAHERLFGDFDRSVGHERRYDRRGLRNMLEAAGFELEDLRHVNPVGALGWLIAVRRGSGGWPSRSFRIFDRLVPLVRHLDALHLPFGLSLWAVARRPTGA
jgi:SAM-dependent methyltransferase